MLNTKKYIRKTPIIEAVKVTAANMKEVTIWCGGKLIKDDPTGTGLLKHIEFDENQYLLRKAFVGHYIGRCEGEDGFCVFRADEIEGEYREFGVNDNANI